MKLLHRSLVYGLVLLALLTASCSAALPTPEPTASPTAVPPTATASATLEPGVTPTLTLTPTVTPSPTLTPSPTPTFDPTTWQSLPVIPTSMSARAFEIYEKGLAMDNNPHAFSKVGDCHSILPDFLGEFDLYPERVRLGDYAYLQDVLDYFKGSYGRASLAAKLGGSSGSVMSPLINDWKVCSPNETPLGCEYRVNTPSFAIISFGTNEATDIDAVEFEKRMRRVLDVTIEAGVVPILATKPDNTEGQQQFNKIIARLAYEYQIPLWNFWAAIQDLPDQGMETRDHLSWSETSFNSDFVSYNALKYGWTVRNLSALELLESIRKMVLEHEAGK